MISAETTPNAEFLWKYYAQLVDLYKFYVDIALKANVFYYAITGGILTYYFSHRSDPLVEGALALPLLMSLGLAVLSWKGARLADILRHELIDTSDKLGLPAFPETNVLVAFLRVSAGLFVGVVVALVLIILRY